MGIAIGGTAYAAQNSLQAQNGAFCLQKLGQAQDCKYASMAACNKDKSGNDTCIRNSQRATTGSGTQSPASKPTTEQPMIR